MAYERGRKRSARWLFLALGIALGMTFVITVISVWEGNREPLHTEDGFDDQVNVVKEKSGTFSYVASVEHGIIRLGGGDSRKPEASCNFLMVVRFKYRLFPEETKTLEGRLDNLIAKGVIEKEKVFAHEAVINKFCGPRETSPDREQWPWKEVWQYVRPVMDQQLVEQAQRR